MKSIRICVYKEPISVYCVRMGQIEFKLSEVMGRHRINQRQLAEAARVRPAAINALYHGARERVDVEQLAAVLDGLNTLTGRTYTVADLLEYTPAADGDAVETRAVLADQPDILERTARLERGESRLIPIEEVAAKHGVKL